MAFQAFVRDILPPMLYRSLSAAQRFLKHGHYHALYGIDRQMTAYLPQEGGFYVELGANNGITQSNTLYFERRKGWRGVLIEPSMNKFLECRRNRADRNAFFCAACVPMDYPDPVVWLTYSNLMTFTQAFDSDLADSGAHVDLARTHLGKGEQPFAFPAAARTLTSILDEAGAPKLIDFLSLDVEGAEIGVLKGLDHQVYRFRYMVIECRDIEAAQSYLEGCGYALVKALSKHDYLFENRSET